jgi:ApeA N-terminal domain 1/Apea-like HEPN
MQKLIFEERGYFWWNDEPLPEGYLAPDNSVTGSLKIDENGSVELDLDGLLGDSARPMSESVGLGKSAPSGKIIRGFLKGNNESVFLLEPYKGRGELKFPGISHEKYGSPCCLVGVQPLSFSNGQPYFKTLQIELKGLEEWFRLGAIRVNGSESKVVIDYERPEDIRYKIDGGFLSIRHQLYGPVTGLRRADEVSLRESVSLFADLDTPLPVGDARNLYGHICDCFILLTDSEYRLDWPVVSVGSGEAKYRLYFPRVLNSAPPPAWYSCPTNFLLVREQFGALFSSWLDKRKEFGPGFYLYLGTRRGSQLYVEHRFVNLIWGIEALHRRKPSALMSKKLSSRVARILNGVHGRDRKWLKSKLKHADEPSLAERIFETFCSLPIELSEERLRNFSKECADRRNDISHFGGMKTGSDYSAFAIDLNTKSEALSYLYHLKLLQEIGVKGELLNDWTYKGFSSFRNRWKLAAVGLVEPLNDTKEH